MPSAEMAAVYDVWRFLYCTRPEQRQWVVLDHDRVMLEAMEPDAQREHLCEHDIGLSRLRVWDVRFISPASAP